MRSMLLCAALLLAACQWQPEPAPGAGASTNAAANAAAPSAAATPAGAAPAGATGALLDGLVTPRQPGRFAPQDACGKVPGARAFREKLAAAVLKRDGDAIAAMADPAIRLGFGDDDGQARFLQRLKEPDSALMRELGVVLSLGCAAEGQDSLTLPWYFAQDPGDVDVFDAAIVVGTDVPLHAAADAKSAVRKRLSWDLVLLSAGLDDKQSFQKAKTQDGAEGFVPTDKLRSLVDYRLLANRVKGEWRITAFLAGD